MTDYLTTIYTQYFAYQHIEQANLRSDANGWYVEDKLAVGPHVIKMSAEIIRAIYATSIREVIAPKIARLEYLGFCQIYKIQGNRSWIRVRFRSAIYETHRARLLILRNEVYTITKTASSYSHCIEDFTIHDKTYMRRLAAAKNRRAEVISAVVALLPQPIAEEIVPDILLCIPV